jgi:serine/threonine protein kinase
MLLALLEERGFVERFRTEARTMATINHPGVVRIYDFGHDQVAYLIMEYIEGETLSSTLNRVGRLTPARTMSLVAQTAEALHAAHEKGVVHRDVKPGNLLVRPNGTLVLTDFGIARSAAAAQLTATGAVLGTASYLAPEQASGIPATAASDVYSLGVVAYQCLSGHRPFEGETPLEIAMKHVNGVARPLPDDVPAPIRHVVERAMAKDPAARWGSAEQFASAARRAATQPATVTVGSATAAAPTRVVQQPKAQVKGTVPFQRGAAAVPKPPTVVYPAPPVVQQQRQPTGRSALMIIWLVLAMVTVLICTAYLGYQANKNRGKTGSLEPPNRVISAAPGKATSLNYITEGRLTR